MYWYDLSATGGPFSHYAQSTVPYHTVHLKFALVQLIEVNEGDNIRKYCSIVHYTIGGMHFCFRAFVLSHY